MVTQVRGSLTRSKDTHPISARFVLTRRQDANELLDGAGVNSNQLVYAVVVEGRFTVSRPGPNAQGMMHVPVLFYIFDARTGRETDGGFRGTLPALSKLGTVYNLAVPATAVALGCASVRECHPTARARGSGARACMCRGRGCL